MKKRWSAVCALLLCFVLLLVGCTAQESGQEKTRINIAVLKGPTGLGAVNLMESAAAGETPDEYAFTVAGGADEVAGKLITGELDIAAIPTNLAATLYQKTQGGIQIAVLNTFGVLYVVENGTSVQSVADLAGKTVVSSGQAAVPEYAFNYILAKNGLGDTAVEYLPEHSELAAQVIAGKVKLAVLPEPFVTQVVTKNPDVRVALDLTEEWDKIARRLVEEGALQGMSSLDMGCLVVRKAFAEEHKETLDRFMEAYRSSVEKTRTDVSGTAALSEKQEIMDAAVAEKALPRCHIAYWEGKEMKASVSAFLKVLFEADPKSVGGSLPDDDFYYQR